MVSLWPWRTDDTSPASFEKALSSLSEKLAKATGNLDNLRQRSRRFKVLWTLYSSFAYLICCIISVLTVGWRNWGPIEYTAVAGGPVIIYVGRFALTTYYDYRTSSLQNRVEVLQKQRDATIDKLKAATKYNTTHQLLEKYGGTAPKSKPGTPARKATPNQGKSNASQVGRTGVAPPPTANIPSRNVAGSLPSTPQRSTPVSNSLGPSPPFSAAASTPPWQRQSPPQVDTPEFAPNAFSSVPQYEQQATDTKWYDRLMDVLLGEDESNPKNRLALICKHCRLVNGQAPPGVKQLEDVGKWRCSGCGTMNGEESEAKRIVHEIQKQSIGEDSKAQTNLDMSRTTVSSKTGDRVVADSKEDDSESDVTQYSEDEEQNIQAKDESFEVREEPETSKPRRGRPKGSTKKKV